VLSEALLLNWTPSYRTFQCCRPATFYSLVHTWRYVSIIVVLCLWTLAIYEITSYILGSVSYVNNVCLVQHLVYTGMDITAAEMEDIPICHATHTVKCECWCTGQPAIGFQYGFCLLDFGIQDSRNRFFYYQILEFLLINCRWWTFHYAYYD